MNALTPIATEIAEAAGEPFKAERIERNLAAAFAANRSTIAEAETNEQIVARLRVQCETERNIRMRGAMAGCDNLREAFEAGAKAAADVDREYDRIIAKYLPKVKALSAGAYDPVFDNTVASHCYFDRI